jgi:hypothetical protein
MNGSARNASVKLESVVECNEDVLEQTQLEQRRSENDLQHDAGDYRAPCDDAPVFAREPRQKKNRDKPESALQDLIQSHPNYYLVPKSVGSRCSTGASQLRAHFFAAKTLLFRNNRNTLTSRGARSCPWGHPPR